LVVFCPQSARSGFCKHSYLNLGFGDPVLGFDFLAHKARAPISASMLPQIGNERRSGREKVCTGKNRIKKNRACARAQLKFKRARCGGGCVLRGSILSLLRFWMTSDVSGMAAFHFERPSTAPPALQEFTPPGVVISAFRRLSGTILETIFGPGSEQLWPRFWIRFWRRSGASSEAISAQVSGRFSLRFCVSFGAGCGTLLAPLLLPLWLLFRTRF